MKMSRRIGGNSFTSEIRGCLPSHESKQEEENGHVRSQHNGKLSVECLAITDTGICVVCGKTSVCKCERCDDFYCSPQCQSQDWPKHRYICFPMPRLIKIHQSNHINEAPPMLKANVNVNSKANENENPNANKETSKEDKKLSYKPRQQLSYIPSSTPLPEDGSAVIVTGFKSSNSCNIRSADKAVTEEYFKVLMRIDKYGKNAGEMQNIPKVHSFALAQMNEKWSRVQIVPSRTSDRVGVYFIDYGVLSFKFLHDLKKIPGDISSLPCYVNQVQLHNVTVTSRDPNVLEKLSHLTNKKFKMQIEDPDDKGVNVKLFHIDTNNLVNSEIVKICQEPYFNRNDPGSDQSHMSYDNEVVVKKAKEILPLGSNNTKNSSHMSYDNDVADDEVVVKRAKEILPLGSNKTRNPSQMSYDNDVADDEVLVKDAKDMLPLGSNKTKNQNNEKKTGKCPIDSTTAENSRGSNMDNDRCMVPPFKSIKFAPQLKSFNVIVVDTSYLAQGLIACILESDCKNFMAVQTFFENWKDNRQRYKPKMKEYCIAQFESEWYRAKVVDILDNDRFVVSYVDFANESEVSSESIRHYPMDLTLPCCTNICAINGLPEELSGELVAYIDKVLNTNKNLMVDEIIVDNITFINCNELLKELRLRKLI